LEQFRSFMIIVLLVAAAVSGVVGVMEGEGLLDTYIIMGILIVNALIGAVQEKRAETSLEALKELARSEEHTSELQSRENIVCRLLISTLFPYTTLFRSLEQFRSFMIIVLLVAAAVSGVVGVMEGEGLLDTYIIMGILIVNALIGAVQEKRAETSLEALKELARSEERRVGKECTWRCATQ